MDKGVISVDLTVLTAEIVSAYVARNSLSAADLTALLGSVHAALNGLSTGKEPAAEQPDVPKPAVPIKKSITDTYLISLEDGQKFKSLKRHLMLAHNMTPEQYREKWGLPKDYPMVAPAYAKARSDLAKSFGLGRLRLKTKSGSAPARRVGRSRTSRSAAR